MMRFIYVCMAFLLISFVGMPVYKGVSSEREKLTIVASAESNQDDPLSFSEIYALADESSSDNPAFLNNIMPAAGGDTSSDNFSNGFRGQEDSALADTPKQDVLPEIILE